MIVNSLQIDKSTKLHKERKSGWQQYLAFCDRQMEQRTLWYLIPLMALPAAVMPISIFLMSYFDGYLLFVGASMLLFFANIIVNIADLNTRWTISLFLATILFNFLLPFLFWML